MTTVSTAICVGLGSCSMRPAD